MLCFCSHPSIYSLRLVEAESIAGGNIKGNCVWNWIQMAMSICIQFSLPAIAQGHTNRPSMANNVCFDWNDSFDVSLMFHTSQAVFSSSLIACLHQKKRQPLSLLSTCLDTFLACRFVCFLRKNEAIVFWGWTEWFEGSPLVNGVPRRSDSCLVMFNFGGLLLPNVFHFVWV